MHFCVHKKFLRKNNKTHTTTCLAILDIEWMGVHPMVKN